MNKSTWILGCLVLALGLIYFFTKEKSSVNVKRLRLPAFVVEKVDKIEILGPQPVRMEKKDGKWWLNIGQEEKPDWVLADVMNVESMLQSAFALTPSHYVTNLEEKYSELGLSKGTLINLFEANTPVWSLMLGNTASSATHYAKTPDDADVYVVKGSFWQLTRNGLEDWRERHIFITDLKEVKALSIKRVDTFAIEKDGTHWIFSKNQPGLNFKPDAASLEALVQAMVSLNASSFADNEVIRSKPLMKINLSAQNEQAIEIYSQDGYLVKRLNDGRMFRISKNSFDTINKFAKDVRDLSIFSFDKKKVIGLKLQNGKIVLFKDKNNEWHIEEPKDSQMDLEPGSVDGMVSMLSALNGTRALNETDKALDPAWQKQWLALVQFEDGKSLPLYASANAANSEEMLIKSKSNTYVINASRLKTLYSGLKAFKKETYDFPAADDTSGFKDLPEDVKQKILDHTKKP